MITGLAILGALYISFRLGRRAGLGKAQAMAARASCELADQAFRAGFQACRIASDDLGVDAFVVEQRRNAGMQ